MENTNEQNMSDSDAKYIPTIGLEIHAELKTASKMFCACKNDPDEEKPNTNICPICLGHPGTLPVLNNEAIKKVLKIGVAVEGKIADFTEWDRKQYFYPDIPKGYQISQYAYPLVSGGKLAGVEITRIHLEEDTAQSTHDAHEKSLINFNRSGVPLMELVTKPVIHDAKTAVRFAKELQLLIRYLGAGEANMEKGEMRVEANVSVCKKEKGLKGADAENKLGTKTEVKNLNSFRAVEKAIDFEIKRQIDILERGERVVQETRGWDDKKEITILRRSKESAHDYRYFPEPDIPKMKISEMPEFGNDKLRCELPELPWVKRDRFMNDYGATNKEAEVFVENSRLAKYFDDIINSKKDAKIEIKNYARIAMNYLLSDYLGSIKKKITSAKSDSDEYTRHQIPPISWAELIGMISNGELSSRGAKDIISMLIDSPNESIRPFATSRGLIQKNDREGLKKAIQDIIDAYSAVVNEYRSGKIASLQFLIGQTMKATKGSANPALIKEILTEILG